MLISLTGIEKDPETMQVIITDILRLLQRNVAIAPIAVSSSKTPACNSEVLFYIDLFEKFINALKSTGRNISHTYLAYSFHPSYFSFMSMKRTFLSEKTKQKRVQSP